MNLTYSVEEKLQLKTNYITYKSSSIIKVILIFLSNNYLLRTYSVNNTHYLPPCS